MKHTALLLFYLLPFFISSQPQWQWVKKATYTGTFQNAGNLTVDTSGNVYSLALNTSTALFGNTQVDSGTVLTKYNSAGTLLWAKNLPCMVHRISTDLKSNIYVSGNFKDSLKLGLNTLTASGGQDFFVIKLDSSANLLWGRAYGGPSNDWLTDMAVDIHQNVYVTGINTGDTLLFHNYTAIDTSKFGNFFLARINSSGTTLWVDRGIQDSATYSYSMGADIEIDKNNKIYVIGAGLQCQYMNCDISFLAKYDSLGFRYFNNWKWNPAYGSTITNLQIDDSLNIYVAMSGGGNHPGPGTLHKYDSLLNLKWTFSLGTAQYGCWSFSQRQKVTRDGFVFLFGHVSTMYSSGTGCGSIQYDTVYVHNRPVYVAGAVDIIIARLNQGGGITWLKSSGGVGNEAAHFAFLDKMANYHVTGVYNWSNTGPTSNFPSYFDLHYLPNDGLHAQSYLAKLGHTINTVGLDESHESAIRISAFPNPSSGIFLLNGIHDPTEVIVVDVTGKTVQHQIIQPNAPRIDLSLQEKGIFLVRFKNPVHPSLKLIID